MKRSKKPAPSDEISPSLTVRDALAYAERLRSYMTNAQLAAFYRDVATGRTNQPAPAATPPACDSCTACRASQRETMRQLVHTFATRMTRLQLLSAQEEWEAICANGDPSTR